MIKIIGDRGEGAGLLTNLAVEKLLETHPQSVCFLIDDSGEFYDLTTKLKCVDVHISPAYSMSSYEEYKDYVIDKIYTERFFRFITDYKDEAEAENIEKLANEVRSRYNIRTFVIKKSVND